MSNSISALNQASFDGFVRVSEMGLRGMITLRGDFSDAGFVAAIEGAGLLMPAPRKIVMADGRALAWMSPDELLVMLPYEEAAPCVAALRGALAGHHALVENVSDARAVFRIQGAGAREVIAKLAPVDMAPGAFEEHDFRRSRLAQVPAAFWMAEGAVDLVCFRSVAPYVMEILSTAAEDGSEVGVY